MTNLTINFSRHKLLKINPSGSELGLKMVWSWIKIASKVPPPKAAHKTEPISNRLKGFQFD